MFKLFGYNGNRKKSEKEQAHDIFDVAIQRTNDTSSKAAKVTEKIESLHISSEKLLEGFLDGLKPHNRNT